jgi:integrin alpha 7
MAVKSLEVIVRANITVKSSIKNLLLRDASTVVSCQAGGCGGWTGTLLLPLTPAFELLVSQIPVMVYLDPMAVVVEGVPWWVILLAVLAGLLVLALLVLLLWKVRLGEGWNQCELELE